MRKLEDCPGKCPKVNCQDGRPASNILTDYSRDTPSLTPSEVNCRWEDLSMTPPRKTASPFWKEPSTSTVISGSVYKSSKKDILEKETMLPNSPSVVPVLELVSPITLSLVGPQLIKNELDSKPVLLNLVLDVNANNERRMSNLESKIENNGPELNCELSDKKETSTSAEYIQCSLECAVSEFPSKTFHDENQAVSLPKIKSCPEGTLINLVPFDSSKPDESFFMNTKAKMESTIDGLSISLAHLDSKPAKPLFDIKFKKESNESKVETIKYFDQYKENSRLDSEYLKKKQHKSTKVSLPLSKKKFSPDCEEYLGTKIPIIQVMFVYPPNSPEDDTYSIGSLNTVLYDKPVLQHRDALSIASMSTVRNPSHQFTVPDTRFTSNKSIISNASASTVQNPSGHPEFIHTSSRAENYKTPNVHPYMVNQRNNIYFPNQRNNISFPRPYRYLGPSQFGWNPGYRGNYFPPRGYYPHY